MKKTMLSAIALGALVVLSAQSFAAGRVDRTGPLLSPEKVEAMKKMLMEMKPDSIEASVKRGEMLFNDTSLGANSTGMSCNACHPGGKTIGGTAEMDWKGQAMKVPIPSLNLAALTFPKAIGPMKAVSTVGGQNNMCIMAFLKGTPLDLNSQEAVDLEAYVYSLGKEDTMKTSAMPAIVHFEIPADDVARARRFYTELFGWKIEKYDGQASEAATADEMEYWMITTGKDKTAVGGGMMKRMHPQQAITNYIGVPSVDRYAAGVERLGGRIVTPKKTVPGFGYFTVCLDTEGNTFALWEDDPMAK